MSSPAVPHDAVFLSAGLGEPANATSQLRAVLRLTLRNVGAAPAEELHDLFTQLGPRAEEAYVTTAEMLRAEGEARGRAEALVQLLGLKFGPLPAAALEVVRAASSEQIATWTSRVLDAGALDEVLC